MDSSDTPCSLPCTASKRKLVGRMLSNGTLLIRQVERSSGLGSAQPSMRWAISPHRYSSKAVAGTSAEIHKVIRVARRQLHASQKLKFLKVSAYLQLCCLAIHKSTSTAPSTSARHRYLALLSALSQCTPNWWQSCAITESYGLMSYHSGIQALLQPIEALVQQLEQG